MGGFFSSASQNRQQENYTRKSFDRSIDSSNRMKCKVLNCTQSHSIHYCKNCNTSDVDHRARDCPTLSGKSKIKCRALNCSQNHQKHYCRICQDNDSNHLATNCEFGQLYYHGTTQDCSTGIQQSKMNPSKYGRLGPGIYFTSDKQAAIGIAKLRQKQQKSGLSQKPVLITVIINKRPGYFKQQMHPAWQGAYDKPFPEIAVSDDKYLRVLSYEFV